MSTKVVLGIGILAITGGVFAYTLGGNHSPQVGPDPNSTTTPATTTDPGTKNPEPAYYRASGKGTVPAVIATIPEARTFNAILKETGLDVTLRGKGPFTVFVPNNAAFRAAPPKLISNMSAKEKKELVGYHVIVGKRIDIQALSTGKEVALSGDTLNFTIAENDRVPRVNGALMYGSYTSDNGVIYLITQVLLPPEEQVIQ